MAIDFMTAVRSRARAQERGARLSGRPQTQVEASAPYVAIAETASERFARGKTIELQEKGQDIQQGQFGQSLELERQKQAENVRLEQERLAESKRAEEARMVAEAARLEEQKRATNLEVEAAKRAEDRDDKLRKQRLWNPTAWCIIVTACTDRYSPEVNVTREFRDKYLGPVTLRGYYRIAAYVAPLISGNKIMKGFVKNVFVNRWVDYGRYVLGMQDFMTMRWSKFVSVKFLKLCRKIGERR